jgi:DNA-binding HxlR family transcriptional regulator
MNERTQVPHVSNEASEQFIQKRGGYNILNELSQTPQRFKDLLERVNISRGTLASRIREAETMGLIEKGIRKSNGSPAYTLTEEGEKTKKQGDKKSK